MGTEFFLEFLLNTVRIVFNEVEGNGLRDPIFLNTIRKNVVNLKFSHGVEPTNHSRGSKASLLSL